MYSDNDIDIKLPVFKACYDVLLYVMNWSVKVQRDLRYTVAEDLKKSLVAAQVHVYKANKLQGEEKMDHLMSAQDKMTEVYIYLRLLSDMHQISLDQYAYTSQLAGEVDKQLANWKRYLERNGQRTKGNERSGESK